MSFRLNFSKDLSDRSYLTQGNQLIATSIGLTPNRTILSCCFNMQQKDYKYGKTDEQVLQTFTIFEKKLKRWAFQQIQKYTHYHRELTGSIFVPEALSNGNYDILSKFLGNLRNNRINSYIRLNINESKGHFDKATTLLKPAIELFKERKLYGFYKLKKSMLEQQETQKNKILIDIEKFSSIDRQNSVSSQPQTTAKKNVLKITYTTVKLNPEIVRQFSCRKEQSSHREYSSSRKNSSSKPDPVYINLNHLIEQGSTKKYQFKQPSGVPKIIISSERLLQNKND